MFDEFVSRKHVVPSGLSAEASVMNKEDKICPLSVPAFEPLQRALMRRRACNVSIEAQFHSHSTSLRYMSDIGKMRRENRT
jgi:hypothetical protein